MAKKNEYNASSIQSLDQHNHLLKRISLTFGRETGDEEVPFSSQKSVAIREIIDNAFDEVIGGYGNRVKVTYFEDGAFEVQDSGRGLPVDIGVDSTGQKCNGIYLCLGVIQSGGKFETDSKRFSSGLNGVGASSTTHLSKRTDVKVYRDGKIYELSFQDGTPGFFENEDPESKFTASTDLTELKISKDKRTKEEKKLYPTGTAIKLWLRDSVFSSPYPVDTLDLTERLRGTSYLIPGAVVEVEDQVNKIVNETTGEESIRYDVFDMDGGLPSLVEANMKGNQIGKLFEFSTSSEYIEKGAAVLEKGSVVNKDITRLVEMDVAFAWDDGYDYEIESYVNTIRTRLGGVHEVAFERSLLRAFGDRLQTISGLMKKADPKLEFDDFNEGLVAVVSIRVSEPQFTGQSKEELGSKELQRIMMKSLTDEISKFAQNPKNTDDIKAVGVKIVQAARNRQFARDQQALNRKKNAIEGSGDLPAKLTDCEIIGTDDSELYIVEGDSAKSSLKGPRLGRYQALLPIRGKIICASNNQLAKVLASQEVQNIIQALGAGSGNTFDIDKLRYGRVFIGTDADADGGDIASLLTSLFMVLFRPLVEDGRLYKLMTPLYVVTTNPGTKKEQRLYASDESELSDIMDEVNLTKVKYKLERLKGLGQGGDKVMNETAMNPLTRTVQRVVIKDVREAEKMLELLYGKNADARKDWISSNPIDEFENID